METKDYAIIILIVLFALTTFDGCENQKAIKESKKQIEIVKKERNLALKSITSIQEQSKLKIDSIYQVKKEDSLKRLKLIREVDRLKSKQVKKELLQDTKPNIDTLEIINFTLSESKEILRKLLNQELLTSQQGFTIESYKIENKQLEQSIVLKDRIIDTYKVEIKEKDIILKEFKKKRNKQLIKVGVISFGVGAVLVAILK